ncbi:MAG: rhodanese-like domain-containing protein [Bacteroidota bacterium]
MTRHRQRFREAAVLAACAVVLGFSSTAIRSKGVFGPNASVGPTAQGVRPDSPTMIQLPEAIHLFESGEALFVDARHAFDFARGHIRGAVNLPLNEFDSRTGLLDSLPRNRVLITYCDGVECNSSIGLASRLRDAGYSGVRIFFAGWSEWQAKNLPMETNTP